MTTNTNAKPRKADKMRSTPPHQLFLKMGIPMICSMVLQAMYNIVDSAFVSNMPENGEAALNALTLAFPMQMLMIAVSIGTGVGVNALVSKSLGQGDTEKASRTAGNGGFLAVLIFLLCVFFGIFGVAPYIHLQTKDFLIADMGISYLQICCMLSMGIIFFSIYEKLLQASGNPIFSTIAQISGAVCNILLDPILIYGWCGLPELGVRGAAYATVLGQILSFLLAWIFHCKVDKQISNKLQYWKPNSTIIREIYAIGLPAILAQALMSVMTYGMNLILGSVNTALVTAYGLYYKIQQFILFAAFGLRDAITPVLSFYHGMRSRARIRYGIRYGMLYTWVIMLAGTLLIEALAVPFSKLFGLSGETEQLCIEAMRIISISFLFAGTNIALQGIFQALDSGLESLIISVCRQILFVLPVAWLFSLAAKENFDQSWLIWLTFPIAELVSMGIGFGFLHRIQKIKIAKL